MDFPDSPHKGYKHTRTRKLLFMNHFSENYKTDFSQPRDDWGNCGNRTIDEH